MSETLWVRVEGQAEVADEQDHTVMFDLRQPLDGLAITLGVVPLSAFYDWADYEYNLSHEGEDESWIAEHAHWHDSPAVLVSLRAIRAALQRDPSVIGVDADTVGALMDELEDCIRKIQVASEDGRRVHLCVVM